jgi:hypothetical protein
MAVIKFLEGIEVPGVSEFQTATATDPTLYIDTVNNKVGFRTDTPGAAFDVNGTIRVRNQLNVGNTSEKNLFVNGTGSAGGQYVQMGNYGSGNYFGITSSENQPKYTAAFGNAGKVVQDSKIITISISGNGWLNAKTTPKTLIPAPGTNKLIIPRELLMFRSFGAGAGWNTSGNSGAWIGFSQPPNIAEMFQIPRQVLTQSGAWYWAAPGPLAWPGSFAANWATSYDKNKALLFGTINDLTSAPGLLIIQLRYTEMDVTAGLANNIDTTITS